MSTRIQRTMKALLAAAVVAAPLSFANAEVKVDPKLPTYKKSTGVAGAIKSEGSDTMNNLMTLWGESFHKAYPAVQIEIVGKGSSTAPPALIAGASNFGPTSRAMKNKEVEDFETKFGYKPTPLPTAIDMLAVFVHKDNPIAKTGLTLQQVDAIFSKNRKGGYPKDVTTWGDLGLTGDWADKPISLYGRNSASGTYGYFKDHALFKGDYKDSVKEQPGSSAVVQGIAKDMYGIGYSGIGYKTPDVVPVPLAETPDDDPIAAEPDYAGEYPLARFLYLYVNYKPGSQLEPLRREFIKLVFSKQGQSVVVKDGYMPVSARIATNALKSVSIKAD